MKKTAEAKWRSLLRQQERSGQSVREFAARQGIAPATFYWWRCRLRRRQPTELVAVEVVDREPKAAGSREVFELGIGDRLALRIPAGFDEAELRRLLQALRC